MSTIRLTIDSSCCVAYGMVQLAWSGHRCTFHRLRYGCHDLSCRIDIEPEFRPTALSGLPPHNSHHAHPRMYQLYAYQMDCKLQCLGFHFQHDRLADRHYTDPYVCSELNPLHRALLSFSMCSGSRSSLYLHFWGSLSISRNSNLQPIKTVLTAKSRRNQQSRSGTSSLHTIEQCVERLLRRYRFLQRCCSAHEFRCSHLDDEVGI